MSATTWFIIAIVGFSLSGVALIAAVFMFLKMNIPAIIGDLTGRTVAREIKAMRESNAASGDKLHRSSRVNIERGTLTEKVEDNVADKSAMSKAHSSKRLDRPTGEPAKSSKLNSRDNVRKGTQTTETLSDNATEVLVDDPNATEVLHDGLGSDVTEVLSNNTTEVLTDTNATEVLSAGATEVLTDAAATEVLDDQAEEQTPVGGTTVLSDVPEQTPQPKASAPFKVIKSLVEVHTDEVIECGTR